MTYEEILAQNERIEKARQKVIEKMAEIQRKTLKKEADDLLKNSGFNNDGSEN